MGEKDNVVTHNIHKTIFVQIIVPYGYDPINNPIVNMAIEQSIFSEKHFFYQQTLYCRLC